MRQLVWLPALFLALVPCRAADDAPAWLRQAAALPTPDYAAESAAVVIVDEESQTIDGSGLVTTVRKHALRILNESGKGAAAARAVYITGSGKVRELQAWLIRPSSAIKYGKDKTLDVALVNNDVYNEVRAKYISATSAAEKGCVFGYESVTEEHAMFLQAEFTFRGHYPVVSSRFSVTLPEGWRTETVKLAGSLPEPVTNGATRVWEMRDLPATGTTPRLAVNFIPDRAAGVGGAVPFTSWSDVSRWLAALADPQAAPDAAITAKARALTTGADTEFARIQKLAQFTQSINYVSIQTGIGRGGGYRPHPASLVFAKSYGDCKDKANLMRALLKAAGMDAFPVAVYAGSRTHVRKEWPSPQQFNHVIVAVKIGEGTDAPAVLQHPLFGRLLIFDPTDPDTPVGSLPELEQGSYGLIASAENRELIKLPVAQVSAEREERVTESVLSANGDLSAKIEERTTGEAAARELRLYHHASQAQYKQAIEQRIARGVQGAVVSRIEPAEQGSEFRLTVEFSAPHYAQSMQGRLLVFKPTLVGRRDAMPLGDTGGSVTLSSQAYVETVKVKLPAGFKVDELPPKTELDTPFGKYSLLCEAATTELILHRTLEMRAGSVNAKDNAALRAFYKKIMDAEQSPVVLMKQ
jgi:hypothetical protein